MPVIDFHRHLPVTVFDYPAQRFGKAALFVLAHVIVKAYWLEHPCASLALLRV
jgi:hypothetical protein